MISVPNPPADKLRSALTDSAGPRYQSAISIEGIAARIRLVIESWAARCPLEVRIVALVTEPTVPSSSILLPCINAASNFQGIAIIKTDSFASEASMTRSNSLRLTAKGAAQRTCFPASNADNTHCKRVPRPPEINSASMFGIARIASKDGEICLQLNAFFQSWASLGSGHSMETTSNSVDKASAGPYTVRSDLSPTMPRRSLWGFKV